MRTHPSDWTSSTIGESFKVLGGGTPSTTEPRFWEGKIPWASSADVGDSIDDIHPHKRLTQDGVENSATNVVPPGTVVVVTRVGVGKVVVVGESLAFSQDCQGLLPRPDVDSRFTAYQLKTLAAEMRYQQQGTTIAGITKKRLLDLPFAYPSLDEQRSIVEEIEKQFTRLDAARESLSKANQRLTAFPSLAIDARLAEVAEVHRRLGDFVRVESGFAFRSSDWVETGVPVVKIANVKKGWITLSKCSHVNAAQAAELTPYSLKKDDVVIAMTGNVGEVAIVRDEGPLMLNQRVGRVRITEPDQILPWYLFYVLQARRVRAEIEAMGYGSSQANVSPGRIHAVRIPVPSVETQARIVQEIEAEQSVLGALSRSVETSSAKVQTVRRAVLREAYAGRLAPDEALRTSANGAAESRW